MLRGCGFEHQVFFFLNFSVAISSIGQVFFKQVEQVQFFNANQDQILFFVFVLFNNELNLMMSIGVFGI